MLLGHLALASSLALAAAPAVYAEAAAVQTVKVLVPQSSTADAKDYAEREQQNKKAADFQGGDLVVLSVSGGALIVLLFLLLILV